MRLKKILSALMAVSVIGSTFVTMAHAEGRPVVNYEIVNYDPLDEENEILNNYGEVEVPEGGAAYLIKFDMTGIALKKSSSAQGTRLHSLSLYYDITNGSNINYFEGMTSGYVVSDASINMTETLFKVDKTGMGWFPNKNKTYAADATTDDLIAVLVVLEDNSKQVKFTPHTPIYDEANAIWKEESIVGTGTWTGNSYDGDSSLITYSIRDGAFFETITLGEAGAPTEPTITNGTRYEYETEKGNVWAGAKIENITLADYYEVKFTDSTNATPETKVGKLDFGTKELTGTVTFDIILNTERTLENIVMEIIAKNN